MYAAIQPNGLVVFSRDTIYNTSQNETQTRNAEGTPVRPTAVVITEDPWWIHLTDDRLDANQQRKNEQNSPHTPEIHWDWRLRVKMVNSTKAPSTPMPTTSTTSTTHRPTRRKPVIKPAEPDYDEQTIIYNYKSYDRTARSIRHILLSKHRRP